MLAQEDLLVPLQELAALQGMREAAQALQAYTGRHMARLNRLLQASYLLDFTLDRLSVVAPLEVRSAPAGSPRCSPLCVKQWLPLSF